MILINIDTALYRNHFQKLSRDSHALFNGETEIPFSENFFLQTSRQRFDHFPNNLDHGCVLWVIGIMRSSDLRYKQHEKYSCWLKQLDKGRPLWITVVLHGWYERSSTETVTGDLPVYMISEPAQASITRAQRIILLNSIAPIREK